MTQVTVVCGPPCSGKTTWVREHAQPGDAVIDYDDIAQQLGSPRTHGHDHRYHAQVESIIHQAIESVRQGRHERAWIIRTNVAEAERLAASLGGTSVLIDAADDTLLARAQGRPNPAATVRAIEAWRLTHPDISPGA